MEKQRHRQQSKLALEELAERAERVGDVDRAKYLRRIVARLNDVEATPGASSADRTAAP
jgi:hypothetical protein